MGRVGLRDIDAVERRKDSKKKRESGGWWSAYIRYMNTAASTGRAIAQKNLQEVSDGTSEIQELLECVKLGSGRNMMRRWEGARSGGGRNRRLTYHYDPVRQRMIRSSFQSTPSCCLSF